MKVKRIFAPDMRQAMRRVRDEVGADAVIVSNQRVSGGVEIVVAREEDYEAAQQEIRRRREAKSAEPRYARDDRSRPRPVALDAELARARTEIARAQNNFDNPSLSVPDSPLGRQMQSDDEDLQTILQALRPPRPEDAEDLRPPLHDASTHAPDGNVIASMQREIHQLKTLLERQINQSSGTPAAPAPAAVERNASADPAPVGRVMQRLLEMGLSRALCDQLMAPLEEGLADDQAWKHVLSHLAESLPVFDSELIERGGMIALLGPTGVGKTTTIGKLAARYVLNHGSAGVALVTTDCYRIAAHEQLKVFGRILDVPVHIVDENRSLDEVLTSLRDKRLVLIDTAGMSGREQGAKEQLEMFTNTSIRLKKLLVLSCSSQAQLLRKAYDCYQALELTGCVLSKLDESGNLGEVLTLVLDKQLQVAYVADGQQIPDDICVAKRKDLVSQAVLISQRRCSGDARSSDSSLYQAS